MRRLLVNIRYVDTVIVFLVLLSGAVLVGVACA